MQPARLLWRGKLSCMNVACVGLRCFPFRKAVAHIVHSPFHFIWLIGTPRYLVGRLKAGRMKTILSSPSSCATLRLGMPLQLACDSNCFPPRSQQMSDNETLHLACVGSSARPERAQAPVLLHRLSHIILSGIKVALSHAASLFLFRLGTQTAISWPGCIRLTSNQSLCLVRMHKKREPAQLLYTGSGESRCADIDFQPPLLQRRWVVHSAGDLRSWMNPCLCR